MKHLIVAASVVLFIAFAVSVTETTSLAATESSSMIEQDACSIRYQNNVLDLNIK